MRLVPSFHLSYPDVRALRIALAAGAVAGLVVIAACTDNGKSITAPSSGPAKVTTFSGGFAYDKRIVVCVNGATASFRTKYDSTGVHPFYGRSVLNNPPPTTVPTGALGWWDNHFLNFVGGGTADGYIAGGTIAAGDCAEVYSAPSQADTGDPATDAFAAIDIKITGPVGSTLVSTDCDIDEGLVNANGTPYTTHQTSGGDVTPADPTQADFYPDCNNDGDARVWGNFFHGSQVTFTFTTPTTVSPCILGYPFTSANTRTSVAFNESEVLSNFGVGPTALSPTELRAWYTDEHALTLGVNQVQVKTNPGGVVTTTPYTISTMVGDPAAANPVNVGDQILAGDQRATDGVERPLFPALFITDVTSVSDNAGHTSAAYRAGDWQFGGDATPPDRVFGTWKSAAIFLDKTKTPNTRTMTPGADPAKNHQNVGAGGVNPPAGTQDLGYSAEVVWDFSGLTYSGSPLVVGNSYRLQFMVHDGDQNKTGGDVGEACVILHWGG